MKKKLFVVLALFFLFVGKVYADGKVGSFGNPAIGQYDEYITETITLNDMTYVSNSSGGYYYYLIKYVVSEPLFLSFDVTAPVAYSGDYTTPVIITFLQDSNFDNIDIDHGYLGSSNSDYWTGDWLKPGIYYGVIYFKTNGSYNYELSYSASYQDPKYSYSNFELEGNNVYSDAFDLEINKVYEASISNTNSVDYFKARLTAAKKTRVYIGRYDEISKKGATFRVCSSSNSCTTAYLNYDPARSQYYYEFVPIITAYYYFLITIPDADDMDEFTYDYYYIGIYQSGTINTHVLDTVNKISNMYVGSEEKPVYRMYNPNSGEHLYTTDAYEVSVIYSQQGWGFEGIGWYTATEGTPVYRLYQPQLGNHLYTSDQHEIDVITSTQGWLMDFDGNPVMYSTPEDDMWATPVYRLYNQPLNGMHHLTTDYNEYNVLPSQGWAQEGVSLYASWFGDPMATDYYNVNF